jgi:LysM repeat protein
MNESSPLVPQGSLLEQKNQGRAKFKFAVLCVIGIHVAGLMALLLTQGCKREQQATGGDVQSPYATDTNLPVMNDLTNVISGVDTSIYTMPSNTAVEPPPAFGTATEHIIVKGDTFCDLAKKYGVTMQALKDANPTVNPSRLQLNQKIIIPAPSAAPTGTVPTATVPDAATGEVTHKVVSGDNLTKIAEKYKVTVNAIRKANNLTSDRIVVGQTLKIPAKDTQ